MNMHALVFSHILTILRNLDPLRIKSLSKHRANCLMNKVERKRKRGYGGG